MVPFQSDCVLKFSVKGSLKQSILLLLVGEFVNCLLATGDRCGQA